MGAGTGAGREWTVPGYQHVQELGSGASGRVVLALHEASGRSVAIKYLAPRLLSDMRFVERFRAEARLLAGLSDPHLVQFLDYVESPEGAAIVMELVGGVSLRAILDRNPVLEPEAALVLLKGSLLGLAAAHAAGVVHRDYKPGNVLVPAEGDSKLADFGIAVPVGANPGFAGTPAYMAPEQWVRGTPSPATDVYAATVVFVECLAGAQPYRGSTLEEWSTAHRTAPVPVDAVPESLRALVNHGMAKDPAQRPASAAAFVDELESVASTAYGKGWEKRGRKRLVALVSLLAALIPRGLTDLPPSMRTTPHVEPAKLPKPNWGGGLLSGKALVIVGTVLVIALVTTVIVVVRDRDKSDESRPRASVSSTGFVTPSTVPSDSGPVVVIVRDRVEEERTARFVSALQGCCQHQSYATGELEYRKDASAVGVTRVFAGDEASVVPAARAKRFGIDESLLLPYPFAEGRVFYFTDAKARQAALGKSTYVIGGTAYAKAAGTGWKTFTPETSKYSGGGTESAAFHQRSAAEQGFDARAAASPEHLFALLGAGGKVQRGTNGAIAYRGTVSAATIAKDPRFTRVYQSYGSTDGDVSYTVTLGPDYLPRALSLRWHMPKGTEAYPYTTLDVRYTGWGEGDPIQPP